MADDGMLMNFALDVNPFQTKPVFKGGRWKDRLQARKSLRHRGHGKTQPNSNLTGSNALASTKTRRFGQDENVEHTEKRIKTGDKDSEPQQHNHNTNGHPKSKDGEFISSLFTSNPSTSSQLPSVLSTTEEVHPIVPSNAPLSSALHNFTSLGLSLPLSTHLHNNLSLTAPTAIQRAALTQLLREDTDAFIQAETGSGKTLAYLLPIVQRILALTTSTKTTGTPTPISRQTGLFALILAPTRELTHQITTVLSQLLSKYPNIVAGQVTGGATKNHEKARLRKGLNILVATPGRLADHLENTAVLDLRRVRWLVLDEGDRLMEMGFEEEVRKVVEALDGTLVKRDVKTGNVGAPGDEIEVRGLPARRTTVLCSATMKMGVQRLGEMSLKDAVLVKVDEADSAHSDGATATAVSNGNATDEAPNSQAPAGDSTNGTIIAQTKKQQETAFRAPAQLKQSYILAPAKQRLVTLFALLKHTFARKGSVQKVIVFLSCADSVDFHYEVFGRTPPISSDNETATTPAADALPPTSTTTTATTPTSTFSPLLSSLPTTQHPHLHKLHGSLTQPLRTSTLNSFRLSPHPSLLLCTDVASRGLDLPNIDLVIEFDPPFSAEEHLHRVGRTARAGRDGRAICFLTPGEEEGYVDVLKAGGVGTVKGKGAEEVLRRGFGDGDIRAKHGDPKRGSKRKGGNGHVKDAEESSGKWDTLATTWQLDVERWVLSHPHAAELARKAFISHVRAYATHIATERGMFDVKALHLGHLAKAFGLREKPGSMGRGGGDNGKRKDKDDGKRKRSKGGGDGGDGDGGGAERKDRKNGDNSGLSNEGMDAVRKMRKKVREQMMAGGADEFNIG